MIGRFRRKSWTRAWRLLKPDAGIALHRWGLQNWNRTAVQLLGVLRNYYRAPVIVTLRSARHDTRDGALSSAKIQAERDFIGYEECPEPIEGSERLKRSLPQRWTCARSNGERM